MDRSMRARVLLGEAAALGVTIEDVIAESTGPPGVQILIPIMCDVSRHRRQCVKTS
jgi:hypothetical protein